MNDEGRKRWRTMDWKFSSFILQPSSFPLLAFFEIVVKLAGGVFERERLEMGEGLKHKDEGGRMNYEGLHYEG